MARKTDFDPLEETYNALRVGNEAVKGFPLALSAAVWAENLNHLENGSKILQSEAASHNKRARSGNRAVKAAAEKVTKAELLQAKAALDAGVGKLKVGTKIIAGSGLAIDIVASAVDVSQGGSISSAGVGIAGGLLGGGAATSAAAGISVAIPPVGIAVGVGVAASAASWGLKELYETYVDLDVREAIDAGDFGYAFK